MATDQRHPSIVDCGMVHTKHRSNIQRNDIKRRKQMVGVETQQKVGNTFRNIININDALQHA